MKPIAWKMDVFLGVAGLIGVFGAFVFPPMGWLALAAMLLSLLRGLSGRL